jgi:hypothetical protein
MVSAKLAHPHKRRGSSFLEWGRASAIVCALSPCVWSDDVLAAKSLFFASRAACVASLQFRAQECANAFVNAEQERQRHAGASMTQLECVKRFHLCELRKDPAAAAGATRSYAPSMLGIELSNAGGSWRVSPVLAVELPPGGVQPQPISHIAVAPVANGPDSLDAAVSVVERAAETRRPTAANDGPSHGRDENAERAKAERRERIRNAPFIE